MSRATDLKMLAEMYGQVLVREQLDPKVVQFIDQMQIPGMPGAQFASLIKPGDPYDAQVVQSIQAMIQRGIPAARYRDALMQVMRPEAEAAVKQGLNNQQILQRAQANPHIMSQYLTQAAQQLLGGAMTPAATPVAPVASVAKSK